jgi:hypothetical protein
LRLLTAVSELGRAFVTRRQTAPAGIMATGIVTAALLASNVNIVARYESVDSLADGISAVVLREVSRYLADLTPPRAADAAEAGQVRRRLLGLLVSVPPAPRPLTASLARAAGWPLPQRVAAVVPAEQARDIPGPLPPGTLADLAGTLSREVLAPLRRLRPEQAERLAATLLAWLESADDASAAARRLHVHPQTIRYRLRQLAGLFGDALTDPDARFRLLLALRARQLLK